MPTPNPSLSPNPADARALQEQAAKEKRHAPITAAFLALGLIAAFAVFFLITLRPDQSGVATPTLNPALEPAPVAAPSVSPNP